MAHLLGIDVGTTATKTLLCDDRGRVRAVATAPHPISQPRPGFSEQIPRHWWQAVCKSTRDCLSRARVRATDVAAVGLSGQMHGSVFLDSADRPLRPAILWNDQRTAEQCEQITSLAGGRQKLIDLVGNPALTGFTAPKILWVREHEPNIYAAARKILLPKDYIRLCLTGEHATEVSDASGTLLLDVRNRRWSARLLSLLEIDPSLMPSLHESTDVTGRITPAAASATGLAPGTPVVGGAADNAAAAVGIGVVRPGVLSCTIGTSGVVFAHSEIPSRDPDGRVHTMCHAVPGTWCIFGCMLSAGGSLKWFADTLAESESRQKRADRYDLLTRLAATSPPGATGLQFLPYLTGERCPHADPKARGAWIGLTSRSTRADLVRAVLEGITFGLRDCLDIIRAMGTAAIEIRTTGGGAASTLWRQLQADIFNAPVVLTNAVEGPAYGAALLAGVGVGIWSSVPQACRACIKPFQRTRPNRARADFYDKAYEIYRSLYPALAERFHELSDL